MQMRLRMERQSPTKQIIGWRSFSRRRPNTVFISRRTRIFSLESVQETFRLGSHDEEMACCRARADLLPASRGR